MKQSDDLNNKYGLIIAEIERLVGQGQLSDALDKLMKISKFRKPAVSLSGRLIHINTQIRKRFVTAEQGLVEHNKIRDSVLKLIYGEKLQGFEIIKSFDNYDYKMEISDKKPISFQYIEPNSIIKFVNHAAIEAGTIIRIDSLISKITDLMFESTNHWVLLYGESGTSKTTQAKILLYDIRQKYAEQSNSLNICIIENINKIKNEEKTLTLEELVHVINESSEEWLLLIDDLHDSKSGKVSEKLQLLKGLSKSNVHLIATSRLSKNILKDLCEDIFDARRVIDFFKEVNINQYYKEIEVAKQKLIRNSRSELTNDDMFQIEYSKYGTNFIFLILAIKYWEPGNRKSISSGIQRFLENEFKSILKKNRIVKPKILFRVFVGACYEGIFDEDISYKDFSQEDSEEDIQIALSLLASEGLLTRSEPTYDSNGMKTLNYKLQHARIAELYLEIFRAGFEFNNIVLNMKELNTLRRFRAEIRTEFQFEKFFQYSIRLEELIISYNNLEIFPESLGRLKSLKKLYLHYNQIKIIPESIGSLYSLEILDLSSNQIEELPESIGNLSSLKELSLYNNQIKRIPNSIRNLKLLKKITLSSNPLTYFPYSITNLTSLERLYLSYCKLEKLPESIGNLNLLQELDLSNNPLKEFPKSISKLISLERLTLNSMLAYEIFNIESLTRLYSLKTLDLSANRITWLPETIGNFESLNELNLSYNELTYLPKTLGKLTSLRVLNLQYNSIKKIPQTIGNLSLMHELYLNGNDLKDLPESIGNLNSLKILNLHNNQLKEVPESIGELKKLRTLNLRRNQLNKLPKSIGELKGLRTLSLRGNQLNSLPESIGNLNLLEKINLRENQLKRLPVSIGGLKSICKLDLRRHEFEELPESIGELSSLQILILSYNFELKELPESIGKLKLLKELDLHFNKITKIPDSIGDLSSLESLDLSNNRLEKLPESIGKLALLRTLKLQNNSLNEIPRSIGNLLSLTSLDLGDNNLKELPESIGELSSLQILILTDNHLEELPNSIRNLKSLSYLYLGKNNLKELPKSLCRLESLSKIYVDSYDKLKIPEPLENKISR